MKKRIYTVVVLILALFLLVGCGKTEDKTTNEENTNQQNNIENEDNTEKTAKTLEGIYYLKVEDESAGLMNGDVYLEFDGDKITLVDNFAQLLQTGTYKIEGNKIIGTYTSMTYLNHAAGGEMTDEEIDDEIEIEVINEENLRDIKGYGISLGNNMGIDFEYELGEGRVES